MKRMTRAWLVGTATLLPFLLLAMFLPPLLNLTGPVVWIARALLVVLGLVAGLIVFFYLRARAKALPEPVKQDDEIDSAIVQARARLAAAKSGAKLGKVPIVLFVGPTASTKTTVVTRSGLDPELLAGEVTRGENVLPTRAVNVWYAEDAVLLEAGGKLLADAPRWGRLMRHLQPSRLATLLPGGKQAPRAAVVCIGCDELLKPGAGESVPALAQTIRARLVEVAGQLGIRLPVYVLFTKADRLPYFGDYVRNWTQEETAELLGATLPVAARAEPGSYTERAAGRVAAAFDTLFRSLAGRRLDVLPRETGEEVRGGAYEFPREFRKVVPLATQFLIDLCRPSQLGVSPFLRGFYFTGVRPIVLDEGVAAPSAPAPVQRGTPVDATSVFDARALVAQQHAQAQSRGGRRVPEWAFLRRLLGGIILRDTVARAVTAGGTRVNLLRRLAVGTVAALMLLLCAAFTTSWWLNDDLIDDGTAAAAGLDGMTLALTSRASVTDLSKLDTLRQQLTRLRAWDTAGPPTRYRWGLYRGDSVLAALRTLYFDRFQRLLWDTTRTQLIASLRTLPDAVSPANDYGPTYDALRAYIITTTNPEKSTSDFLAPELMAYWVGSDDVDTQHAALARQQFEFYASELPLGNPYADARYDASVVAHARRYLGQFSNVDQFYQGLIAGASQNALAVRYPSNDAVVDTVVVPGAFTRAGWTAVQAKLANIDSLLTTEEWVVGEATVPVSRKEQLAADLAARYRDAYIATWQRYLANARLQPFGDERSAANRLGLLGNPPYPSIRVLELAAPHTQIGVAAVDSAFQPVRLLVPADTPRTMPDATTNYLTALRELQLAMNNAAQPGPERANAANDARAKTDNIQLQVTTLASDFWTGRADPAGQAVRELLLAPISRTRTVLGSQGARVIVQEGSGFCSQMNAVLSKYPFRRGGPDATTDEVSGILQPGKGLLWTFHQQFLTEAIVQRGRTWGAATSPPFRINPDFVNFFIRAAQLSQTLYGDSQDAPIQLGIQIRPQFSEAVSRVTIEFGGRAREADPTRTGTMPFNWSPGLAGATEIRGNVNGREERITSGSGVWAALKLLDKASWSASGNPRRLTWRSEETNTPFEADLTLDASAPMLVPESRSLTCPAILR